MALDADLERCRAAVRTVNEAVAELDAAWRRCRAIDVRDDAAVDAAWIDVQRAKATIAVALDRLASLLPKPAASMK